MFVITLHWRMTIHMSIGFKKSCASFRIFMWSRSIVENLSKFGLKPDHLVAASFDGALNISGQHTGAKHC